MRNIAAISLFALIFSALAPFTALASGGTVISGATADLNYVYTDDDRVTDYTYDASYNDGDSLSVFDVEWDYGFRQYLYMGSNSQFDKLYFDIDRKVRYFDSNPDTRWEYFNGTSWKTLSIVDENVADFSRVGTRQIKFKVPTNWREVSAHGRTAYWVRVSTTDEIRDNGMIDQISARVYNLQLTIRDEDNRAVTDLHIGDFELHDGTDNKIYAMRNLGEGVYQFALRADYQDHSYTMVVDDARFERKSMYVNDITTETRRYTIKLDDKHNNHDHDHDHHNHYHNDPYVHLSSDGDCSVPFTDLYTHWAKAEVDDLYCRGIVSGRSTYTFAPNENITRAEFLKMVLLNAGVNIHHYDDQAEPFRDVNSWDWYRDYVTAGYELEVLGYSKDFRPNDPINRAEAVTMLVRLADEPTNSAFTIFPDVSTTDWFSRYLRSAWEEGVVEGYTDGTFRPNNKLTRAEAAAMVSNGYDAWYN